ncbi:MAG: hypothetical protein K2K33_01925, partial [Muribaculaceae bacterium]|nr:hypothetical protein [Muribaculaceae bacterium]
MKRYTEKIEKIPASTNPKVPAPLAPMLHLTNVQLRFTDIDMLGHVNNTTYLQLLHLAKTSFLTERTGDKLCWN